MSKKSIDKNEEKEKFKELEKEENEVELSEEDLDNIAGGIAPIMDGGSKP